MTSHGPGHTLFTAAAADKYDRYVGRYSPALARALVDLAAARSGERALDVGCGPGALTTELAALLGAQNVAAVDPSPSFVEACRARNPEVDVREAPAEKLPFEDDSFDHVLSQLVLNFMTDAAAGVAEMSRVSRPGGRLTSTVWDYRGEMTMLVAFWESVAATDPAGSARDERLTMRYGTPDELQQLWSEGGLQDIAVSPLVVTAQYSGFEDLWEPFDPGVGPVGAYMASTSAEQRARVREEFRRRLEVGDEPFQLTARAWAVTGVVPGGR
ncbi:MAG TPA: methyltransferase domain-containing protein [Candidatus Limnocylindrales bacterium]|nr:methyltransferase domain-containing protein [Candidatus Limnocylindrales bacterium]